MRWLFGVLLVLLGIHMNGQQTYVDSLANIVATTENDKLKVQVLIELCYSYYSIDSKIGIKYGLEALDLGKQIQYDSGIVKSYRYLGANEMAIGNYDKAEEYTLKSIELAELYKLSDEFTYPNYNVLYLINNKQGNLNEAFRYVLKYKEMATANNSIEHITVALSNIGNIYWDIGDIAKANKYYEESLHIAESQTEAKNSIRLIISKSNYAATLDHNDPRKLKLLNEIILTNEENGNTAFLAYNYFYLGLYQLEYLLNVEDAHESFKKSLKISAQINDPSQLANTSIGISKTFMKLNQLDSASKYLSKSLSLAEDFDLKTQMEDGLKVQSELLFEQKNPFSAYNTLLESYELKTEIFNKNLLEQTSLADVEYESEKKETEIARQELVINKQDNSRRLMVGGTIGGLVLLGSLFFAYTQRSKRKQKEIAIALQLEKQRADDLYALGKAKMDFFNNINHELRTPISLVMAPLEEARKKAKHIDLQNDIDMALRNSKRLLSLTDEIMDLARLDEGQLKSEKTTVYLSSYLNRVFNAFYSLAESRNIELLFDNEIPSSIGITTDIPKLEKILNNLISNAIKYSNSGGYVKIALDLPAIDSGRLKISVEDNGQGIPENELSLVFDRYFQSSITPQSSGTGIGLAFVKELCLLLGGDISVQSVLGQGSSFSFSLPVEVSTMDKPVTIEEESSSLSTLPALWIKDNLPSILIVEDNQEMADYLSGLLSKDYNCTNAINGKRAIEIMQTQKFDLISSDIMMPEMDGFQFREEINKNENWKTTPFILLSARTLEEDILRGFQLGIDDYITKPFSALEYKARIYNLLKNKISRTAEVEEVVSFKDDLVERAKQYVIEHLEDSNFRVQNLADELNYSTKQLGRILKKQTGLSSVEFLLELRLLKAYKLLKARQFSTVNEVRYQIGIDSHSYFTTKFKERFGIKPSDLSS